MAEIFTFDHACPLFNGLNTSQLKVLGTISKEAALHPGDYLMKEGDKASEMYIVLQGTLEVIKSSQETNQSYVITTLAEGDSIGEVALLDQGLRSASVRALTEVKLRSIKFTDLERLAEQDVGFKSIFYHLAKNISHRLRQTSDVAAEALKKKLEEYQNRVHLGHFLVVIIVALSLIIYSLEPIQYAMNHATNTTAVAVPVIVFFTLFVFLLMKVSKLPARDFGITLINWKRSVYEGLFYSLPCIPFAIFVKYLLIHLVPAYASRQLFEPYFFMHDLTKHTVGYWLLYTFLYIVFVPAQELMIRGSMQGILEKFLTGERRVLMSILISNLIFSTAHVYLSAWIAPIAFTGGLFLGWLYSRTHNLIGVIVSHAILGAFILCVLGP